MNDYRSSGTDYAKEFNKNPNLTTSINGKLKTLDKTLNNLSDEMKRLMDDLGDTNYKREVLENDVNRELEQIKLSFLGEIQRMMDDMANHHVNQRTDALHLQTECQTLKKEVLELYQRVTEVQRKLNDMEFTVGQDEDRININ